MHARRSLLFGVCLLACDPRPAGTGEARDAAASEASSPAAASDSAADPAASPANTEVQPEPPESAPAPAEAPAPSEAALESIADLEARAWTHYRAHEYEAAGAAFAQLTTREPTIWKHPYNAACAASLRQDYAAAQLALVEAFRRGGDAARGKAKRDRDLEALHALPWWSELLAADQAQLDGWQFHEEQPTPAPVQPEQPDGGDQPDLITPYLARLIPYGPGESPVDIRSLTAMIEAPWTKSASPRVHATFEVDKRKPWTGKARLITTCEIEDGRYFTANHALEFGDALFGVGRSRSFDVQTFTEVFTDAAHELRRCELRFIHFPGANAAPRSITESCYTGTELEAGPCRDFQRVPSGKLEARMTARFVEGGRTVVWAYAELGAGIGPRPSERYHVKYDCEFQGSRKTGNRALLTPGLYELLATGEFMQASVTLDVDPKGRCELVLERTCCDLGLDTGVAPLCVSAAGVEPGPCKWE